MFKRRLQKRTDEILISAKAITKEQLKKALEEQKLNGHCLGKILVELGYIDEDKMAHHIAKECKIPYLSLEQYEINKDLLDILPEDIIKKHGLIPLDLIGDILTIGIVNAIDEAMIKRIEELTGFKVRILVVTTGDFNRHLQEVYELSAAYNNGGFTESRIEGYVKAPSYSGGERRRFPRFSRELRIKYEFNDEYNINPSINISQGGFLIRSKSPLPVDSHIVARIELPTAHEDVIVISRIVRVERLKKEDIYLIAASFSSMDTKDSRKLAEYIKSLKN